LQRVKKEGSEAAVIERAEADVRDTYLKHDNELSNPETRRLFADHPPELNAAQQEILASIKTDGLAVVPFTMLFDEGFWSELESYSSDFEQRVEDELENPINKAKAKLKKAKPGKPAKKKFVLKRDIAKGGEVTFASPWVKLAASPEIVDVVNSYLGMWSKLSYVDQWYTAPGGTDAERLGSQRWHRDYNDQYLIKVFLYMSDVDKGSGPFEYVPGSARGGPYANEWPWQPLGDTYPDQAEFTNRIPESAAKTLTAPAGTLIFCDTSGFHRGGFATERRRVLGVLNYVSRAALESLVERNYSLDPREIPADATEAVKFALT
jgi:ectoine hydroxylase-related dioxygenase (phytanoyl-CoA dioxygenase family)